MKDSSQAFCFVCGEAMFPYFQKDFGGTAGLSAVDYWRCSACGMVVSKTHMDMTSEQWNELNHSYHAAYLGTDRLDDDPRWLVRLRSQSETISKLAHNGILPAAPPWLDYGCGDGKLASFLRDFGLAVIKFDRYMSRSHAGYVTEQELISCRYNVVINTSVFEHVRSIESLDTIADLVADSGVLALHVLVRETIPQDPSWFYLLPVHCAFFTNRSMQILFDRWSFRASIYHLESRMWFWFRQDPMEVGSRLESLGLIEAKGYFFKKGFVDYWK